MKTIKLFLTAIAVLLCSVMANAHDFEVDGIYYNIISSDAVEVTFKGAKENSYDNEYMYRIVIPSTVTYEENVYRVTRIGSNAFYFCTSLTSVVIPEGVTSIKSFAFYRCSSLTEITFPKSLTTVDYKAFDYCGNITDIHIGSVESWLSIAFDESYGRPNRTSSSFNLYLDDNLLTNLEIPTSINTIPNLAFAGCISIVSITLYDNITSIGDYAFYGCKNLYRVINYSNLSLSAGSSNHGYAAYYAKKIITGSELTTIDDFQFCTSDGVHQLINYIGNDTIIVLPNNYNGENYIVGDGAFMSCSSIKSITIPKGVTSIGNYAFDNCTSLEEVVFEDSEETLSVGYNYYNDYGVGEGLFYDCPLQSLYMGRNLKFVEANGGRSYGYSPFYNKNGIVSIKISDSVTSINNYMFYGCSTLANISIPNSIETIGDYAFYGCSGLQEIIIPNSVTAIDQYAFDECSNLRLLVIGTGVLSIGAGQSQPTKAIWLTNTPPSGHHYFGGSINYVPNNGYFFSQGPTSLPRYIYPYLSSMFEVDGIKYVPVSPSERTCDIIDCVYDSTMIQTTINPTVNYQGIEMSVKKVMPYAFYQNNYIKKLSTTNQGDIESGAFYQCNNIETLVVSNLGHVGASAFAGCTNLEIVTISNQGHVYSNAFSNCSNLKTATIANKGNIESQAFYKCTGLEQVDISNQGYIGRQAFYECTNLKYANINNAYKADEPTQILQNWDSGASNSGARSTEYTFKTNEDALLSFDWVYWDSGDDSYVRVTLDGTSILQKSVGNDTLCDSYTCNLTSGEHTLELYIRSDRIAQLKVSNITIDYAGIRDKAFSSCSSLEKVTLGDSVGALGNEVFYQCISLQDITIPNSINSIGLYCFSGCSSMKSVFLGDGITFIKGHTFQDCIALENAKMGSHVSSLNFYAFSGCSALKNIELGCSMTSINSYAFENCSSLSKIIIPQNVINIENNVFKGCVALTDVIIEDRSTELKLGSNGSSPLFADCPLDSIYIGGKITYSSKSTNGYSPFYRNTSLRIVTISDQEDQIYENEFYGCTNLKNVTMGHGVKSIDKRAFSGCNSLDKFSFGSNVNSIGAEAFSDCTKMTELTSYAIVPPVCGANALDDINKWSCVLKIPRNCTSAYQNAEQWKEFFFIEDVVEVKKYAVIYMVDNEIFSTDSLAVGESIVPIAEPAKEGYTFSGWSNIPETMPAEDITITGTFTANTYTITYMVDEEIFAIDTIAYGDTIVPIAEPSREGYTFSGWSSIPETMPAEDVVIKGSFNVNYYALKYIVDNEPFATDSIAYGTIIELREEPIKEGYKFSGWSEAPETMPAHDVEIYGNFIFSSVTDVKVDSEQSQKVLENNQLFIIRPDGKKYNTIGQEL